MLEIGSKYMSHNNGEMTVLEFISKGTYEGGDEYKISFQGSLHEVIAAEGAIVRGNVSDTCKNGTELLPGQVFPTNNCGCIEIIKLLFRGNTKKQDRYLVRFINTSNEKEASRGCILSGEIKDDSLSKQIKPRDKFKSRNYGDFEVLGLIEQKYPKSLSTWRIRFIKTGYENIVTEGSIIRGQLRDPYYPSIYGVACVGNTTVVGNEKLYDRWNKMISRCYNSDSSDYKSYGAKGVTVCDRWLCFEYFLQDVVTLPGYNETYLNLGIIQLDKDKLQPDVECKVYSPETCCWLLEEENTQLSYEARMHYFRAYSPIGEVIVTKNVCEFARTYNLQHSGILRCLYGEQNQHKGWHFEDNKGGV